jgi:RNA:NAD 2'-phosphotransferase (TPT1/KptA family)
MAIRKKDRPQYLEDLRQVKQMTFWGYSKLVVEEAKKTGREIDEKLVYRVVAGQFKDRHILETIKIILNRYDL